MAVATMENIASTSPIPIHARAAVRAIRRCAAGSVVRWEKNAAATPVVQPILCVSRELAARQARPRYAMASAVMGLATLPETAARHRATSAATYVARPLTSAATGSVAAPTRNVIRRWALAGLRLLHRLRVWRAGQAAAASVVLRARRAAFRPALVRPGATSRTSASTEFRSAGADASLVNAAGQGQSKGSKRGPAFQGPRLVDLSVGFCVVPKLRPG